jgi:hypothetical protein
MSRIANKPVGIPKGVEVAIDGSVLSVKGPKGRLELAVHDRVEVFPEALRSDGRERAPALEQHDCLERRAGQGTEFGDRLARPRDRQVFARCDAVDDVPAVVAELTDADLGIAHGSTANHI